MNEEEGKDFHKKKRTPQVEQAVSLWQLYTDKTQICSEKSVSIDC